MIRVFIDGSAGTTGLRIRERLSGRNDLALVSLPEAVRKDPAARGDALNSSDIAFLCLPDAAAVEAVSLVSSADTVIIDTSTAHRTAPGWTYGFPELTGLREKIAVSKRIDNPGCHASGFIALVAPLREAGLRKPDARLSCFSLTGYSGGGKKMIADYKGKDRNPLLATPRQYGLSQVHKHLPEMQKITGLVTVPAFCPIVADFYSGMEVTVPLFREDLSGSAEDIKNIYRQKYGGPVVRYAQSPYEEGFAAAGKFSGCDGMEISVSGNENRILLMARYDNLGKGASGAAVQCMNLVLGIDPTTGLQI